MLVHFYTFRWIFENKSNYCALLLNYHNYVIDFQLKWFMIIILIFINIISLPATLFLSTALTTSAIVLHQIMMVRPHQGRPKRWVKWGPLDYTCVFCFVFLNRLLWEGWSWIKICLWKQRVKLSKKLIWHADWTDYEKDC